MGRWVRLKLLGDGWHTYGGATIPDDRIVEISEKDAANFLRHRGSARSVEFLGWVDDHAETDDEPRDW